jgi:hypothetical protein
MWTLTGVGTPAPKAVAWAIVPKTPRTKIAIERFIFPPLFLKDMLDYSTFI